jgi:hypothetical protein
MFIQSYENLRKYLYTQATIEKLIQFEYSAFEEATVPICTFVFRNSYVDKKGCYLRLTEFRGGMEIQRQKALEAIENPQCGFYYEQNSDKFSKIPGNPVAYWLSESIYNNFENSEKYIRDMSLGEGKNVTTNNAKYILCIWEVPSYKVGAFEYKWLPCAMGGDYRKWYGNIINVIDWSDEAQSFYKKNQAGRIIQEKYWNLSGVTWGKISSSNPSFRLLKNNQMYQETAILQNDINDTLFVLAILNSKPARIFLNFLAPTLNFQLQDICNIPIPKHLYEKTEKINRFSVKCVENARSDWDAFETSWDFKIHPLIAAVSSNNKQFDNTDTIVNNNNVLISECYKYWEKECNDRFNQLKANEEELNRIFIDIYGLQDELTPEVDDKDVTVRKADLGRDIRSFISYAVGCMFGRYSLEEEGLILAGQPFSDKFSYDIDSQTDTRGDCYLTKKDGTTVKCSFEPTFDNIIPITDEEYFPNDIVTRFVEFVRTVYGAESLETNLEFIANALGTKGATPREIIRNYFIKDFYQDHVKIYQKRPIYWLFDSGKQNGFKALIYMHRYNQDTVGIVRTDYLHKAQSYISAAARTAQYTIETTNSTAEKSKATKAVSKYTNQLSEIQLYDQAIAHIANKRLSLDLDDGVKTNYAKFQGIEVAREGMKTVKVDLLSPIK